MSKIDLHMHSNISTDGTHSVAELIQMAKDKEMKTIALTDHNSVRGVKEAISLGKEAGINVIPGIEIDTMCDGIDFHMLAYGIDFESEEFQKIEQHFYDDMIEKSWQAAENFIKLFSLDVSKEVLESIAVRGVIVPEDLGDYLLKQAAYEDAEFLKPYRPGGSRSDNPNVNFYWDYFAQGGIAYVKEDRTPYEEIIDVIHRTGGIAVIAHPNVNFKGKDEILEKVLEKVDGIEVFSSYHTEELCEKYFALAKKHQLKVSCGSDFHGQHKPKIQIGGIPGIGVEERIDF